MRFISVVTLSTLFLAGCASMSEPAPIAVSLLNPTQGNTANGSVSFVQKGDQVLVDARIDGLTPGLHGFHIHEKGDCSAPDGTSAGGHFNPGGKAHGNPAAHGDHHAGDFGNLTADAYGKASLKLSLPANEITLAQNVPHSIVGRALIVHADADDYKTQPTGNSGKRVACGVIGLK